MGEMIERVARALAPEMFEKDEFFNHPRVVEKREAALVRAYAAIVAMRDPTPLMTSVARESANMDLFTERSARECWQIMIDVAATP